MDIAVALMRFILVSAALCATMGLVYGVFVYKPEAGARDILMTAIGAFTTLTTIGFNWFYASSASSASKDATIADQGKMLAAGTPPP